MSPSTPERRTINSSEDPKAKESAPWMHYFPWIKTETGKKLTAELEAREQQQTDLLGSLALKVAEEQGIALKEEEEPVKRVDTGWIRSKLAAPQTVDKKVGKALQPLADEIIRQIRSLSGASLNAEDEAFLSYWLGNPSAKIPNPHKKGDFDSVTQKIKLFGLLEETIGTVLAQSNAIDDNVTLARELASVVVSKKAEEYGKTVNQVGQADANGIHISDRAFGAVYSQDMNEMLERLVRQGKITNAEATELGDYIGIIKKGKAPKSRGSNYQDLDRKLELVGILTESLTERVAQETLTPAQQKQMQNAQLRMQELDQHALDIEKRRQEVALRRTEAEVQYAAAEQKIAQEAVEITKQHPEALKTVAGRTIGSGSLKGPGVPAYENRQTAVIEALERDVEFQELRETMGRIRSLFPGLSEKDYKLELTKTGLISATSAYWVQATALLAAGFNESDPAFSDDLRNARIALDAIGGMSSSDVKSVIQAAKSLAEKVEKVKGFVGHPVDPDKLDNLITKICGQRGYDGELYLRALAGAYNQDFLSVYFGKSGRIRPESHIADIRRFQDGIEKDLSFLEKVKSPTSISGQSERQTGMPESDPREVGDWILEAKNLQDLFKLCKDPRNIEQVKQSTGLDITKKSDFLKFVDRHFLQNPMRAAGMIVFDDEGTRFSLGELIEANQIDGTEYPLDELFWLLLSSESLESVADRLSKESEILGYRANVKKSIGAELEISKADAIIDHLFARLKVVFELKKLFADEGLQPGFDYNNLTELIERMKTTLGEQIKSPGCYLKA